jgi:hypothetical protein
MKAIGADEVEVQRRRVLGWERGAKEVYEASRAPLVRDIREDNVGGLAVRRDVHGGANGWEMELMVRLRQDQRGLWRGRWLSGRTG